MRIQNRELGSVFARPASRRAPAQVWIVASALGLTGPHLHAAPQGLFETQGQVLIGPGSVLPVQGNPQVQLPVFGFWTSVRADDGSAVLTLIEGPGTNTAGIYTWSEANGLTRLLGGSSALPGGSADAVTVGAFTAVSPGIRVSASGQHILFGARLAGSAVSELDDSGLYLWSNGVPQLLVREGFAAPGIPGAVIGSALEQVFPDLVGVTEDGICSFRVRLALGGGIGASNDEVIYRGAPGNLTIAARDGAALPSGERLDELNAATNAPSNPVHRLDAAGNLLFACRLLQGSSATPLGVDNDQAVLLSRPGQPLSVLVREGDPAPYPGTRYGSLIGIWVRIIGTGPVLAGGDPGAVFMTSLSGGSSAVSGPEALVLVRASGSAPLARIGDPIAGLPGVSLSNFEILTFAYDAQGRSAFVGRLGGAVTSSDDAALLRVQPGGPIEVLARQGDLAPDTGGKRFGNNLRVLTMDALGRTWFSAGLDSEALDSWWVHDPELGLRLVAKLGDEVVSPSGQVFPGAFWSVATQWTTTGRPAAITNDGRALMPVTGKSGFTPTFNRLAIAAIGTRTLSASPASLSIAAGGGIELPLQTGAEQAGQIYLLLGSLAGQSPGLPTDAGLLPLNPDALSAAMLSQANQGPFQSNFGLLSDGGTAVAGLQLSAGLQPSLAGQTLTFAGLTIAAQPIPNVTFVSNAAQVLLAP